MSFQTIEEEAAQKRIRERDRKRQKNDALAAPCRCGHASSVHAGYAWDCAFIGCKCQRFEKGRHA